MTSIIDSPATIDVPSNGAVFRRLAVYDVPSADALLPVLGGVASGIEFVPQSSWGAVPSAHALRSAVPLWHWSDGIDPFARHAGGARIFLKREDLNHTGSHKINNVLGQALLAVRMGKRRVIAETGAGQHGVATATACALFGLECVVYMGETDIRRQSVNVARMAMLGATVVPVTSGSRTLKDAINEAFRDWVASTETTHYIFGTAAGPLEEHVVGQPDVEVSRAVEQFDEVRRASDLPVAERIAIAVPLLDPVAGAELPEDAAVAGVVPPNVPPVVLPVAVASDPFGDGRRTIRILGRCGANADEGEQGCQCKFPPHGCAP